MHAKGSTARIHMAGPRRAVMYAAHQHADSAFNPDLENAALPGLQRALRGGPPHSQHPHAAFWPPLAAVALQRVEQTAHVTG